MKCEQMIPYLPGHAGGDLRHDTAKLVERHLASCTSCREEARALGRVSQGLSSLAAQELEPPPSVLDAALEAVGEPKRRFVPPIIPPNVAPDLVRVVQDNREAIASAGATALVAAGAAYALWRAFKRRPVTPAAAS